MMLSVSREMETRNGDTKVYEIRIRH